MKMTSTVLKGSAFYLLTAVFTMGVAVAQTSDGPSDVTTDIVASESIERLIEEYHQASTAGWSADERPIAYRYWLDRFSELSESYESNPNLRPVEIIRLSLANGLNEFGLSQTIAEQLAATASDSGDEIFWRLESGEIANQRFLQAGDIAEAQEAIAAFQSARKRLDRVNGYEKYVNPESGLSEKIIVGAYLEASLRLMTTGPTGEIAKLFLDSEQLISQRIAPRSPDDDGDLLESLERSRYGREAFIAGAMITFAQIGDVPKAEVQFQRLEMIDNLNTPVARYLINYTQRAYANGGAGYQSRLQSWVDQNANDNHLYEVLFALANDQAAKQLIREARRNYARIIDEYAPQSGGNPLMKSYVVESAFNLMNVYAGQGEFDRAIELRDRFIQLAPASDARIERVQGAFEDHEG